MSAPDMVLQSAAADIQEFLRTNIAESVAAFDEHEAFLDDQVTPVAYLCNCGFHGVEREWNQHLAERMAGRVTSALLCQSHKQQAGA